MDYVSMQNDDAPTYAIAMSWFRQWQAFVQQKESEPPGPVDNSSIMINKNGIHTVKAGMSWSHTK
jgi:ubiquitin carboxyl-terminal hydrolase 20/33